MTGDSAWLEWRTTGLGASDLARAHTGQYGGAYAVVAEKLGRLENDIDPADAQRGHDWEQAIADGVHALTGYWVTGEQLWVTSPENKRWLATIDGLLATHQIIDGIDDAAAVLEVKTSRQHVTPKWGYYEAQVQWQMLVCGKQRALVALAVIGVDPDGNEGVRDLRLRWIERDDYMIGQLVDLAEELWEHVEAGTLPDPDEHTRLGDVKIVHADGGQICPDCEGDGKHRGGGRRKKCARCNGKGVANIDNPPVIDDYATIIEDYARALDYRQQWDETIEHLEAKLRDRMGQATEAVTSDGRWRLRVGQPVHRFTDYSEEAALVLHPEYAVTKLDRARFKTEQPDLYDELKVPTPDRRLTVREMTPHD